MGTIVIADTDKEMTEHAYAMMGTTSMETLAVVVQLCAARVILGIHSTVLTSVLDSSY